MGGSTYSNDAYNARASFRSSAGIPVFDHSASISSGAIPARVHARLDPRGVKLRESRDSEAHPVTVPIAVVLDTTGSMAKVPEIVERNLPKLMGTFLADKASGKRYLGDAYPAILVGAVDDYAAMRFASEGPSGTLQIGQFESGIEIDEDLERLWLTGQGGGSYEESYELALYFMARHTAHDAMEKRGRRGHLFIVGDEHAYSQVQPQQVSEVIGDLLQDPISFEEILFEAQKLYHVYFVLPRMTQHYSDESLYRWWVQRLGQQNVLRLKEPEKICELIAAAVAVAEEHVGIEDLEADGLGSVGKALVPLTKVHSSGNLEKHGSLPALNGPIEEVERR